MYYLRAKPSVGTTTLNINKTKVGKAKVSSNGDINDDKHNLNALTCSLENKDECLMCGS